jgi:hypothetical protein
MSVRNLFLVATVSAAALVHVNAAHASSLALNCTEYASSDVPVGCTTGTTPSVLSTPGAYTYGNASLLPASSSGGIITGSAYPSGYTGASFYDAYVFTIGNSQGDSISSTINLGSAFQIGNFEERLYSYTGTAPTVGAISGALDFWTLPAGSTGTVAVLPSTVLPAGTYVLEVRGDVTGSSGGSYSGTLQLSPVPLPAAAWLLLSGIVGLVLVGFVRSSGLRPTTRGLTFA